MSNIVKNSAPLVELSVVAPSLESLNNSDDNPNINMTTIEIPGHDGAQNSLVVPIEVKFQDKDSIMSSCSKLSDLIDDTNKSRIPDGGWGWMVVFSSFIMSLIMDGISFSFGILYIEFVNEFEASSSVTSWIGSLFVAVPLLTGPIMSALVDKYGCRSMTILGGLISTLGFILSSYAKSIVVMYLTFGILAGLGLGLTYVTAVVSIAFWFEKRRNLAVGLGACGTGVGTFVYAPFTTYLLGEFGWRGAVLLLSGTLLNLCVCGALMRDPDWIIEQNKLSSKLRSSKSSSLSLKSAGEVSERMDLNEIRDLLKNGRAAEFVLQSASVIENNLNKEHHHSVFNIPTFIKENEKVPLEVLEQLSENKRLYKIIVENYPSLLSCRSTSDKGLNKLSEDVALVPVTFSMKVRKSGKAPKNSLVHQQFSLPENQSHLVEPLLEKKTGKCQIPRTNSVPWIVKQFSSNPNQNYFKNMRLRRQSLVNRGAFLNRHKYRLRASSCPNIYRVSMTTLAREEEEHWYSVFVDLFKENFEFSLFLEFHFFLMSLSTVILFAWFMTPYFYLADHMKLSDYSKTEASFVLSTIGVTNTIGMVLFGWAGDQPWTNVSKTYTVCLILCGIFCSAVMFFTNNYILLVICAAFYGIFLASSFSFTPIILVELVPLDKFTTAYGLILLCQGIGHLGGPAVAGFLYDVTLQWNYSFYLSGFWIVVSGILIGVIPFTKNRKMCGGGPAEKDLASD